MNEVKEGVHAWADIVDTFAEFSSPNSYKSIKIGGNDAYTKKKKRRGKVSSEYKAKRKKYEFAASVPCSVSPPWSPQACMTATLCSLDVVLPWRGIFPWKCFLLRSMLFAT